MRNPQIKQFIDFFYEASRKIRDEKPRITKGKDGWLVKYALKKLSKNQLEQLACWFLKKKKGLATTIGAMLSEAVLESLKEDMMEPDFWKEVDKIYNKHFSRPDMPKKLLKKSNPFTYEQINKMREEIARLERKARY